MKILYSAQAKQQEERLLAELLPGLGLEGAVLSELELRPGEALSVSCDGKAASITYCQLNELARGLALLSGGEHLRPERIGRRRCIEDGLGNVLRDGLLEQPILHVR